MNMMNIRIVMVYNRFTKRFFIGFWANNLQINQPNSNRTLNKSSLIIGTVHTTGRLCSLSTALCRTTEISFGKKFALH
jgi:hypothetical protein